MGFVVKEIPEITVNVDIEVPGEKEKSRIAATWVLHSFEAYQEKHKLVNDGKLSDEQLVAEDLISAGPFYDDQGVELPYSADLIKNLMGKTYFRTALLCSWWDAQMCRNKVAEKNS